MALVCDEDRTWRISARIAAIAPIPCHAGAPRKASVIARMLCTSPQIAENNVSISALAFLQEFLDILLL